MGIYIPNMEIPKGIEMLVVFSNGTVHKCLPGIREYVEKGTAVPVPPHGDLIEESKVLDIVFEWCPDDDGSVGKDGDLREMLDVIEALPTIIPASEEGET